MGFITTLWGEIEKGFILLWDPLTKRSSWFASAADAEKAVEAFKDRDLYVGIGLSLEDRGSEKRCPAAEISAIAGLWADVDAAHGVHKKQNLPPTVEDALKILDSTGFKPTVIVDSGHGLQPWWLFKELWTFDSEEERRRAASLASAWQAHLVGKARERGWQMDSTGDLARIMRVPGTTNLKDPLMPVPVRILLNDGPRYGDPVDFENVISFSISIPEPKVEVTLHANAEPPKEKFELLMMTIKKFELTWDRKRSDFKDQSPSSYCFSLSMFAVRSGWTDQEIADLLVAWRRKEKEDLKLDRPDWYGKHTIAKARVEAKIEQDVDLLASGRAIDEEEIAILTNSGTSKDPEKRRRLLLDKLSSVLRVRLESFLKHGREKAIYSFKLADGREIAIGDFKKLASLDHVQGRLYDMLKIPISNIATKQWKKIMNYLLDVVEELNPDVDDAQAEILSHINTYLRARKTIYTDEGEVDNTVDAIVRKLPFQKCGKWYVHAENFCGWLELKGVKTTLAEIRNLLRLVGFDRKTVADHLNGTSHSYWRLNEKLLNELNKKYQGLMTESEDEFNRLGE